MWGTLEEALNKPYCGTLNCNTGNHILWKVVCIWLETSHLTSQFASHADLCMHGYEIAGQAQALRKPIVVMINFFFLHEAASASLLGYRVACLNQTEMLQGTLILLVTIGGSPKIAACVG